MAEIKNQANLGGRLNTSIFLEIKKAALWRTAFRFNTTQL